jgi:hypothetical protein
MNHQFRKLSNPTRVLLYLLFIGVMLAVSVTTAVSAYSITVTVGDHGVVDPGSISVDPGAKPSFYITPDPGYHIDVLIKDGTRIPAATIVTFDNVISDRTLSVTFARDLGSLKVSSSPNGATIFIDGVASGTTSATVDNIPAGTHELRLALAGYNDETQTVTVYRDDITNVPKITLDPQTIVPTSIPTTTTIPTTTVKTTTTTPVPTTKVTTTVRTTTTTPVPTATATATTTATVTATQTQTTTAATTVTTSVPATTGLPYIFPTPTDRIPLETTVVPTGNQTIQPNTTVTPATNMTQLPVTPAVNQTPNAGLNNTSIVIPVVTPQKDPTVNGSTNTTGTGLKPPAGLASWNVIIFLFIAAIPLILLLAHDYLGLGHLSFPQPLAVRAGVAFGQVVCGAGMLFVLSRMIALLTALTNTLTLPLLLIVLLLGAYMIFSALALAAGSLLSRPLRWTLKVHVVIGVIVLIVTPILLFSLGQGETMGILVTIVAAPVSALLALWQDHSLALQVRRTIGFPFGFFNGDETRIPSGSDPYRRSTATRPDIFPPELADRYTSVDFLGMGGISHVFRAMRLKDGKTVAVKIPIRFDETTGKSFMKEILAWEGLRHPNIVEITEVNILPIPYVEMEFLKSVLADLKTPLPVRKAAEIITGVANGLAYAHEQGIIHRDIKPQNILLDSNGVPKISDWGMSRLIGSSAIPTIAGFSLAYAAPEQISPGKFGETDERTDIYQLGVVFYELVTGKLLFPGDDLAEASNAIISKMPVPPSEVNPLARPLDPIILKCLQKDPGDRYQSVRAMLKDLKQFLGTVQDTWDDDYLFEGKGAVE